MEKEDPHAFKKCIAQKKSVIVNHPIYRAFREFEATAERIRNHSQKNDEDEEAICKGYGTLLSQFSSLLSFLHTEPTDVSPRYIKKLDSTVLSDFFVEGCSFGRKLIENEHWKLRYGELFYTDCSRQQAEDCYTDFINAVLESSFSDDTR